MTGMEVDVESLIRQAEKAKGPKEVLDTLSALPGALPRTRRDTKEEERMVVKFLLQRLVVVDSRVAEIVQEVLSEVSRLTVWEVAVDTLQAITRESIAVATRSTKTKNSDIHDEREKEALSFSSTSLETTLKSLLRLLFPTQNRGVETTDGALSELPFVVQIVAPSFEAQTLDYGKRQELFSRWIRSLLRLPLLVANACEKRKLGMPLVWTTSDASSSRGFYFRLLRQAISFCVQKPSNSPENIFMVEEYAVHLTMALIRQRGATETVARVFQSVHEKTEPAVGDMELLNIVRKLATDHLSPRQSAILFKFFEQCSRSANDSSWGLVSGRVLLGASTAVREATVHDMLYNSPSATEHEIKALINVLLTLEHNNEDSDDESDSDDDGPATAVHQQDWTYGQCALARLATHVAQQWSSLSYIRQTDPQRQVLSGKFLELSLPHLKSIDVSAPLVMNIVDGVTPRLESLQPIVRQSGMRVAEAMARATGQDLSFDELRQIESEEKQSIEDKKSVEQANRDQAIQKHLAPSASRGDNFPRHTDDDSVWDDGDEEFQPYGLEDDEEDLRETARPNYLRDCLDLLRTPESEEFAYSHHETALQELPSLVRSRPMDLEDVSPSLAMQVLRMENKFNMDRFDDMVTSCLVALIVEQPISVAETLIDEIFREGSLADRLKALSSLCEAAYELSGFKDQEERKAKLESTKRLVDTGSRISGRRRLVPEPTTDLDASERTRRWGRKAPIAMVANQFTVVAAMWFYALLELFIKHREDPVLWGGAVGSTLLSKLLLTLALIVELSGRGRATEAMAKDLFECVWGFRQAEVSEVRIASLCAVTSAISHMQDVQLLHILYDERPGNLSTTLKQIVTQDPDQECRSVASTIAQNVARALESMGPQLLPSA